jgi:hypothetical protein
MIHHFARALAIREASTRHVATPVPPQHAGGVRIHRDPSDSRRTVIAGRFADVCAALERMAAEPEAA